MSTPSNLPTPENYPSATGPIAEIFGFNKPKSAPHGDVHTEHTESSPSDAEHGAETVHTESKAAPADVSHLKTTQPHTAPTPEPAVIHASHDEVPPMPAGVKIAAWRNISATILPYIAIFAIGLFTYFYFFNKVDFGSIFKTASKTTTTVTSQKGTQMQNLISQNRAAYNNWIAGYYYDVSDSNVLDPNTDNSGNGLTNFQKFLLNLNPKSYSTMGLDKSDTELLAEGINPLSGNPLTDKQKNILNQYIDLEVAMNRLTMARMQQQGQVAGTSTQSTINPRGSLNLIPTVQASVPVVNPYELDIDQTVPGKLEIPSLNVDAPLIWTQDPKNFETDLKNGVVHYPGTAMPGEIGTSYISGHSSNYVWIKSNYNHIFTHLDELPDFGSFQITVTLKNGKQAVLHYVVKRRQEYSPTDQAQFQNGGTSTVALSTCWPVGSTAKRYVVFGELTQVDQ